MPNGPYPPTTQWTYSNRRNPGVVKTSTLHLYWEPDGSGFNENYTPDEVGARTLWDRWVAKVADLLHDQDPARYEPGDVAIDWTVWEPWEAAPFVRGPLKPKETFLTHFSTPMDTATEERVVWTRLPVLDLAWEPGQADKGGFIQQVLGWKPSPLQPVMNVHQLAEAAGLNS
ncbi:MULTISPECIES: hypothetical protein [unclassified Kitasatospora]|uniref:hypothetical protein n=1 Tax=unclassified Kitasatospora TaxID=2633591 RepID=UPI00070CB2EF|nr:MULTISPECIES: hypothetical protein [unclassified Kitasatospora]KQV20545.1 hypothetical protein ASC99_21025 [Kitasatospora sp. Root107]KRB69124.1 hypothetical protein ASE03_28580 [Kitasatospora sp. Root187]